MKILILGANGYVGKRCKESWSDAVASDKKIHSTQDVLDLLEEHKPNAVLNAAGVRGKPNVDWCEDHQLVTILGNTKLPIIIAEACQQKGVYLLHIGSGCIFYGDSPHEDKEWREEDMGNPTEVTYSRTKWAADLVLSTLPNVGIARIRMPIDWIPSNQNMIDKLATYPKVIDVENSVTIVDDMVDVFHQLLEKKAEGIFHVTNPGKLKHKEIVALYEEMIDPTHTNEWISNEDLVKQGLATKGRSNNFLHSKNLGKFGIEMREVHKAMRDTMQKYKEAKEKGVTSDQSMPSC
ncbi:MAG: sugar nucleotide-binding protein [Candidatus Magasanikbacteria bacterium]|nr:sugar nucleotide-binding protein [Candidatus Magasanikbacteria bacterium]NCS72396.1 sugar nucleotide-binding protein [Candidatus Magasanikbacteria bacterium]